MSEKRNVPKLRFKEFRNNWKEKKLGDLFEIKAAGDLKKDKFSENYSSEYVYPMFANATENMGLKGFSKEYKYSSNKITVTGRGELGKAFVRNEPFDACGRLLILIPKFELNLNFISEYINNKLNIFIESTGVPQLTAPNFKTYKIKLPELEEQNRLGNFLKNIDKKVMLLISKLNELKCFKKFLLQQLFTQKLRFKIDNQFDDNEWKKYLIKDSIIEIKDKNENKEDLPIISSTLQGICLQEEYFDKKVSSKSTENYKKIRRGMFTYRSMSDTGKFRFNIQDLLDLALVSPAYPVFKVKDFINPIFLEYYLNYSPYIKKQLLYVKEGGTRYALSISKFKKIKIIIPNLKEQEKIAKFLLAVDKKIDLIQNQIELTEKYKKGLLQQMFI